MLPTQEIEVEEIRNLINFNLILDLNLHCKEIGPYMDTYNCFKCAQIVLKVRIIQLKA